MSDTPVLTTSLGDVAARQLANATKTVPQMVSVSPRWLVHCLEWIPVEAGILRVNRVKNEERVAVGCSGRDERPLPQTFVDYDPNPREYLLCAVNTVVEVHTRISDLYSSPHNQIGEQLRLSIEVIKEQQESELINSAEYGILANTVPGQRIESNTGLPTPDALDSLIAKCWKEPGFFLAHPDTIAAFGRECTRRGVPPATITMFGSPFITWRGIPIVPSNKVSVKDGRSSVILMRVGQSRQGVVGLFQPNLPGEQSMGLSVRFMGINDRAIASYLVSLYCSLAILTEDAVAVLDNVDITKFHSYA
ncbi:MAG: family 2A encapsulin nanocompartment shell protein [Azospirillaceae bacterium]|nr:family 2A encapsulin nanocompartment shell protein [Azospirillaceae bacterium]